MKTADLKREIAALESQKALLLRLRTLRTEVNALRIESLGNSDEARTITIISQAVCEEFGIHQSVLMGKSRKQTVVLPRFALQWLAHHVAQLTYSSIARVLGCDHHTIMNGIARCQDRIDTRDDFRQKMKTLEDACKPSICKNPPTGAAQRPRGGLPT